MSPKISNKKIDPIFPSPLTIIKWEDVETLNDELIKLIDIDYRTDLTGEKITTVGGWQSKQTLFDSPESAIQRFKEMVLEGISYTISEWYNQSAEGWKDDWDIEMWANINHKSNENTSHDHTVNRNQWSGIYYLDAGGSDTKANAGMTIFEDKQTTINGEAINRVAAQRANGVTPAKEVSVIPETGKMAFFPGALWHRVGKYEGENRRITIAFNLKHPKLDIYMFRESNDIDSFKSWMKLNFRGIMRLLSFIRAKVTSN